MRSYDEYKQILELWELGINKKAIAHYTGIPRTTVFECINRYGTVEQLNQHSEDTLVHTRRIYRLRVTLDAKYPNIIQSCVQAGKTLLPETQVGLVERLNNGKPSCFDVSIYHKDLPLFFPQHRVGLKHSRPIKLESWQQRIVTVYPLDFFRGLYHSDGSRSSNVVNGKDYPRYQFTNYSDDIRKLFCDTCDRLGLHWTTKQRAGLGESDIFVSKRKDVEFLDRVIGLKS